MAPWHRGAERVARLLSQPESLSQMGVDRPGPHVLAMECCDGHLHVCNFKTWYRQFIPSNLCSIQVCFLLGFCGSIGIQVICIDMQIRKSCEDSFFRLWLLGGSTLIKCVSSTELENPQHFQGDPVKQNTFVDLILLMAEQIVFYNFSKEASNVHPILRYMYIVQANHV